MILTVMTYRRILCRSIAPAFRTIHHFNTGQTGTVFATMMYVAYIRAAYALSDMRISVGCFAGLAIQLYQEKLYTYGQFPACLLSSFVLKFFL